MSQLSFSDLELQILCIDVDKITSLEELMISLHTVFLLSSVRRQYAVGA